MKILNNILTVAVLFAIGYVALLSHCRGQENEALRQELADLQSNVEVINGQLVQIPVMAKALIGYENDFLTVVERLDSLNTTSSTVYVPAEGSYEVVFVEDTVAMAQIIQNHQLLAELLETSPGDTAAIQGVRATLDALYYHLYQVETNVQDHGFTFSPSATVSMCQDWEVRYGLDSRLYYDGHWGVGLGIGLDFPEPADDEEFLEDADIHAFISYRDLFGMRNIGLGLSGGRSFTKDQWLLGGAVQFYFKD